jgi:hypothetical protein
LLALNLHYIKETARRRRPFITNQTGINMKQSIHYAKTLAALAVALLANAAHATEIYANNPAPGDAFTAVGDAWQAIGSTGWYYGNVRNNTTVGISTANPHSGNGSVSFVAPADGKADVEFLSTRSLGALSALSSMSYDWYRVGTSGAYDHLQPSLRVLVDRDGDLSTGDRGYLVFERTYNGLTTPEDSWVTDTISSSTFLWNTRFYTTDITKETNINTTDYAYDATLAEWKAFLPNAAIVGFSSGVGSGWGSFSGAVDNISWTIDGVTTVNNFEVARSDVPEPASVALLGLGLMGLVAARRRKTNH